MPQGKQANHVRQSHDPERPLRSHVVQARTRTHVERQRRAGFNAAKGRTKAELAEDLRLAVERTARGG